MAPLLLLLVVLVFEARGCGDRGDRCLVADEEVPTVAVVTNAFSAGALIAMSAEQVVMLPGSEIGAALPISADGTAIWSSVAAADGSAAMIDLPLGPDQGSDSGS